MANVSKILKKQLLLHFDPVLWFLVLSTDTEGVTLTQFFLLVFICLTPLFQEVRIDKLDIRVEGICIRNSNCYINGKKRIKYKYRLKSG